MASSRALSVAGAWVHTFSFIGFLATKPKQRDTQLQSLLTHTPALVFYEAPHRVRATVTELAEALSGARTLIVARELTKVFETITS